jgi:hypothetical protein
MGSKAWCECSSGSQLNKGTHKDSDGKNICNFCTIESHQERRVVTHRELRELAQQKLKEEHDKKIEEWSNSESRSHFQAIVAEAHENDDDEDEEE